jgi:hypothetical protein
LRFAIPEKLAMPALRVRRETKVRSGNADHAHSQSLR